MNNTIQLYVDEEKQVKGFPLTSPDRVIDSNGKSIKDKLKNNVKFDIVGEGTNIPPIDGKYDDTEIVGKIDKINEQLSDNKQNINTFSGKTETEKFITALKSKRVVGNGKNTKLYLNEGEVFINNEINILRDTCLTSNGKNTEITFMNTNRENNVIDFRNVEFDNVCLVPYGFKGKIIIKDCKFKNCSYTSLFFKCSDTDIYIEDCEFVDFRPNKKEWIENTSSAQFWRFNPINIYGNNVRVFIKNSRFENIMAEHFVYIPRNLNNVYIDICNNYFDTVEGNGICMESSVTGIIKHNTFKNIGLLRGIYGDRTTDGVGTNAIFALDSYCNIVISDNYIVNVAENGIEGRYKEISRNYIENTGCRVSEGYITPSVEGIWGCAEIIKDNVIINPLGDGIVVEDWGEFMKSCTVSNNNIINTKDTINSNNGIKVVCNTVDRENVHLINNSIEKFNAKYYLLNPENAKLNNFNIQDVSSIDSKCNYFLKDSFDRLQGVSIMSNKSKELPIQDYCFKDWTEGNIPSKWNKSNGSVEKVIENGITHLKLVSNDIYGKVSQKLTLDNCVNVITLTINGRSTNTVNNGKIYVIVRCSDDNGTTVPNKNGAVWSSYKIPIILDSEFTNKTVSFKATQNTEIMFGVENAKDIIELRSVKGFFVEDN